MTPNGAPIEVLECISLPREKFNKSTSVVLGHRFQAENTLERIVELVATDLGEYIVETLSEGVCITSREMGAYTFKVGFGCNRDCIARILWSAAMELDGDQEFRLRYTRC